MKNNKVLLYLMVLIAITLCIPSIIYLINNKTVDGFSSYYTYTLQSWRNMRDGLISGIIVVGLLLLFGVAYIWILKKEQEIFKTTKNILIFIAIISFVFMLILPYLSSDIYYYIGDSWVLAKYGENPYYTSVGELQETGINDEILNNTGYWKNTTSVYGPLWNIFSSILVSLSFGHVTVALFIFKIASYLIHVLNSYLIYKITKSRRYMLLYGLNPLVLLEFLSNVHNDIYLVFFILLALYFLVRKKNIYLTMLTLALSISVKYSTALLVPFILIYCFKDKTIPKRILYCLISGLSIVGVVVLLYLPFYRDITIFTNMLVQGTKYSQSILALLMNTNIFKYIDSLKIPLFLIFYIILLCKLLFEGKVTLTNLLRKYNLVMLLFIFIVLTNFQKWYILWILPTIMWQSKNTRKFIIFLTITAIIPSLQYFVIGTDAYLVGRIYSLEMLIASGILVLDSIFEQKFKFKKEKQCQI